jgi:hypothetical protein
MRFAHKASAPGVGRQHAFSVLSTTKNGRIIAKGLRQKGKNFFKEQYNHLGPKEFPETMELPTGIWKRY